MALDVINKSNVELIRITNGCDGSSYQDIQDAKVELKRRGHDIDMERDVDTSEEQAQAADAAISADARYIAERAAIAAKKASGRIVKHLWIIFVLLPVVLGILFAVLTAK